MTGTSNIPTHGKEHKDAPALLPLPAPNTHHTHAAHPGDPSHDRHPSRGKLFIKTHGCQMNEYDSAKMADVLTTTEALELTDNPEEADIILINTCSIREKAQEKVFSQLGRWRSTENQWQRCHHRRRRLRCLPRRRNNRQTRPLR